MSAAVILEAAQAATPAEARAILSGNAETLKAENSATAVAAAFEEDMRPVVGAVVSALEAGDVEAFRGLRAMLPHLLAEVNESAGLQEALGRVLGEALVRGLFSDPTEARG
jgi:phage gp29-like protein